MLYKELRELEDCEQCTLYGDFCTGGTQCYGGSPIEPPCCMLDDNDDMDEVYARFTKQQIAAEEAVDRRLKAEQAKIAKNKQAAERRREAAWEVRDETRRIKSLYKKIASIEATERFRTTFKIVNSMINGNSSAQEDDETAKSVKVQVAQIRTEIAEIEVLKKKKLEDLRKKRKSMK